MADDPWLPERLADAHGLAAAEEAVLKAVKTALFSWLRKVTARVLGAVRPDPLALFSQTMLWNVEIDRILASVRPIIQEQFESLGMTDWERDSAVRDYLAEAKNRLARTPDEVYGLITEQLALGVDLGEGVNQLADRVKGILSTSSQDYWQNRAKVIARTETISAFNGARQGAFEAYAEEVDEPLEKLWLATIDSRTRDDHRRADGQRVPVEQPFVVGGHKLMYPGDPSGPADQVIQCRCTQLLVKQGETLDLSNRQSRRT